MSEFKDWPVDPANGYLLCSPERPRPKDAAKGSRWAHTSVYTVDSSSDYTEDKGCRDCGATWTEELPE